MTAIYYHDRNRATRNDSGFDETFSHLPFIHPLNLKFSLTFRST